MGKSGEPMLQLSLRRTTKPNLCKENNININKLSTLAGVRQSTINSIINGHSKKVQVLTILRICLGLNMQLDEFFNDKLFKDLDDE